MDKDKETNIEMGLSIAQMYLDCAKYYLSLRNQITVVNLTICGAIAAFFDPIHGVDKFMLAFFLLALAIVSFVLAGRHTIDFIYYWNQFFRISDTIRKKDSIINQVYEKYSDRHDRKFKNLNFLMFGANENSHIYLWPLLNLAVPTGIALIILFASSDLSSGN